MPVLYQCDYCGTTVDREQRYNVPIRITVRDMVRHSLGLTWLLCETCWRRLEYVVTEHQLPEEVGDEL